MRLNDLILSLNDPFDFADKLDLSKQNLRDLEVADNLPDEIPVPIITKSLNLSGNQFTSIATINRFLKLCNIAALEKLDLSDNPLTLNDDYEDIKSFSELLAKAVNLNEINITGTKIERNKISLAGSLALLDKVAEINANRIPTEKNDAAINNNRITPAQNDATINNNALENVYENKEPATPNNIELEEIFIANNEQEKAIASDEWEDISLIEEAITPASTVMLMQEKKHRPNYGTATERMITGYIDQYYANKKTEHANAQLINNNRPVNASWDNGTLALFKRFMLKEQLPWHVAERVLLRHNNSFASKRRRETAFRKMLLPNATPLAEEDTFNRIATLQNIRQSLHHVTHELIPLTLSAFLLHDLIAYGALPNLHYDAKFKDILSGFYRQSWGWLGAEYDGFPNEAGFWLLQTSLTLLPIITVAIQTAIRQRGIKSPTNIEEIFDDVITAYQQANDSPFFSLQGIKERFAWGKIKHLLPYSQYRNALQTSEIQLNWQANNEYDFHAWIQKIAMIAKNGPIFFALPAIRTLANVVNNTVNYKKSLVQNANEETALLDVAHASPSQSPRQIASVALQEIADESTGIRKEVANYERWTLGQKTNRLKQALYGGFFASALSAVGYANYRYGLKVVEEWQQAADFYAKENKCHAQRKIFSLSHINGEYDCTYCGDWSFVSPWNANDPQACLTGLLHSNLTLNSIYQLADRFKNNDALQVLDLTHFSAQIPDWTQETTQQFFNQLVSLSRVWQVVNVSTPNTVALFPNNGNAQAIGSGFSKSAIHIADISGLNFGTSRWCEFLKSWMPNQLQGLFANHINFMDQGADCYAEWINEHNTTMREFSFGNDGLTNQGATRVLGTMDPQNTVSINLEDNQLSGDFFNIMGPFLDGSNAEKVVLNDNDFTGGDYETLGKGVVKAQNLKEFHIDNAGMIDDDASDFSEPFKNSNKTLSVLSANDNQLTGIGVAALPKNIDQLNCKNNMIDDDGIVVVKQSLSDKNWYAVNLSKNPVSDEAVANFWQGLSNTTVRSVKFEGLNAADKAFQPLLTLLANQNVTLDELSVANNQLSNQFVNQLLQVACGNNVKVINVANNHLTVIFSGIENWQHDSMSCQVLTFDHNPLEKNDVQAFVKELPKMKAAEKVSFNNNPNIDNEVATLVSENLLNPIADKAALEDAQLPVDMDRGLNKSTPLTNLNHIGLSDTSIDKQGAIPLRHVGEHLSDLNMEVSNENEECDLLYECQTSGANQNKPFWSSLSFWRNEASEPATSQLPWDTYLTPELAPETSSKAANRPINTASSFVDMMSIVNGVLALFVMYMMLKKFFAKSNNNASFFQPKRDHDDYERQVRDDKRGNYAKTI